MTIRDNGARWWKRSAAVSFHKTLKHSGGGKGTKKMTYKHKNIEPCLLCHERYSSVRDRMGKSCWVVGHCVYRFVCFFVFGFMYCPVRTVLRSVHCSVPRIVVGDQNADDAADRRREAAERRLDIRGSPRGLRGHRESSHLSGRGKDTCLESVLPQRGHVSHQLPGTIAYSLSRLGCDRAAV